MGTFLTLDYKKVLPTFFPSNKKKLDNTEDEHWPQHPFPSMTITTFRSFHSKQHPFRHLPSIPTNFLSIKAETNRSLRVDT
jgi:hypothetical protein